MTYGALQTMFDATNPAGAWYYKTGYLDGEAFGSDRFIDTLLAHCDFPTRRRSRGSSSSTWAARWAACPRRRPRSSIAPRPST